MIVALPSYHRKNICQVTSDCYSHTAREPSTQTPIILTHERKERSLSSGTKAEAFKQLEKHSTAAKALKEQQAWTVSLSHVISYKLRQVFSGYP